jgi:ubiquinol-cytochrome c reductase iron-sulfur subunit
VTRINAQEQAEQDAREDRAARWAAVAFGVAIVAALALTVVYLTGGNTQVEGVLLFVAFVGVGMGFGIWVKFIVGASEMVEERYPMTSPDQDREDFGQDFGRSLGEAASGGRRRFLLRLLAGVGASLGLALTVPLLSLGPIFSRDARRQLFVTAWSANRRLVNVEGEPLRLDEMVADQLLTVFPEGAGNPADSQAVLIGTRPGLLDTSALDAPDGTVEGIVCYSKICTHAGCPVGLYRAAVGELLCPCHQSTFDVYHGAAVLSGPTGRPLPQLPIGVDDEGYLIALGDFTEPVGPSFWNLTHDVDEES